MSFLPLLIVILSFAIVDARVTIEEDNDGVLILNSQNFHKARGESDFVTVKFDDTRSEHGQTLAVEYAKTAKQLKAKHSPVKLAKVDVIEEKKLADDNNIISYPKIYFFRNGVKEEYDGGRTSEEIIEWLETNSVPDRPVAIEEDSDGVLILNWDNFDKAIVENDFILVEFYAPWCRHCQDLAPEYAEAAKQLKANNSPIKLAKVDAIEEKWLADYFEVTGYPTIYFFRNEDKEEYDGGRTSEEIIEWLETNSVPDMPTTIEEDNDGVLILNWDNFDKAIAENDLILVKYYSSNNPNSDAFAPEYAEAAKQLKANNSPIKLAKYDISLVTGHPVLFYYRNGVEIKYDGGRTSEEIIEWLETNSLSNNEN